GVAAIRWQQYVADVREANQSLDQLNQQITASGEAAIQAAVRTRSTTEDLNAAREAGRELTEQEIEQAQRLLEANDLRLQQLQEDLELAQQATAELPEQEAAKENLIAQTEASIRALEGQNDALRESIGLGIEEGEATSQAVEDKRSAIDRLTDTFDEQLQAQENFRRESQAVTAEALAEGNLSEEQARQQNLQAEQDYLNQRIALLREKLPQLRALAAETTDPEEAAGIQQEILQAESEILDTRTQIAQNAAEERRRIEEEAIAGVEEEIERANALILQSQNEQIAALRQAQLDRAITAEEAEQRIQQIQSESTTQTVALKEEELAEIRQLREAGTIDAETAAERERALQAEIRQLTLQGLEQQIAAQEAARQAAIQAIQDELAVATDALEQQIALQQRKTAQIQAQERALQRQNELIDSQTALTTALNNLDQARSQAAIDGYDRALQIQQQLASNEELSARERRVLEEELQRIGFQRGSSELEILEARQAEEERLAQQQQAALEAQQTAARTALDLELRRNELAARRAVIEAEIAETRARQNVLDAEAALREAELSGDATQVQTAQTDLNLARQEAELSAEATTAAQEAAAAQAEIGENARDALEAQQEAERVTANAAEQARQFAAEMERAAAASERIRPGNLPQARRRGGPVAGGQPYLVGEEGPELIMPRRSGYVLTAPETAQLLTKSFNSFSLPSMTVTATDTTQLLKAVRQLEGKLDKLGRPQQQNNFHLNTNDPMKDAVRLQGDMLARQIRGW
ncbi:hypothetical protein, partial [Vacuolonema iberomarrocanum]|uniref:hypothetical protein n=1 Tax=Vacuolonema iberomarrocanum TaxID=3454632 RepID=UPI0019F66BFF|nr:hypothetical protein [filamentous cyanobacterium LEGE 07170]